MLRRSPIDGPVNPAPVSELHSTATASSASSSLLPSPSITQWSLMSKVQRPSALKPLQLQDRLKRLSNAPAAAAIINGQLTGLSEETEIGEGSRADGGESQAERRIRFLENSIRFLRQEHEGLLAALHQEVDSLKRTNQDLQFRLSMTEAQIIVDKRRYSFAAKTMEDRRLKQEAAAQLEALTHCEPVERVQVSAPSATGTTAWVDLPQSPRQPGSKSRSCDYAENMRLLNPATASAGTKPSPQRLTLDQAGMAPLLTPRLPPPSAVSKIKQPPSQPISSQPCPPCPCPPQSHEDSELTAAASVRDCQAVIRRLQAENQRQAAELEQVKSNLRDVIRSQKLTHSDAPRMMVQARASAAVLDAPEQTQLQSVAHRQLLTKRRMESDLSAREGATDRRKSHGLGRSTKAPFTSRQKDHHRDSDLC